MLSRLVRNQLIAFAVITVLVVGWVGVKYVAIGRFLDIGSFQVTAQLAATGGLYQNAIVTYNGIQIGLVKGVKPARYGAVADLRIDNGTQIPADLTAEVHSVSPVGEQYIDLKPSAAGGPLLSEGGVIPRSRTTLPTSTNDLLNGVNRFVASVPRDSYRTVVSQLGTATNGSGPALGALLTASRAFVAQAQASVVPTVGLINSLSPLLASQQDQRGDIDNSITNLALFSDQLVRSDSTIRSLLHRTPATLHSVDRLVDDLAQPLPMLLANVTADAELLRIYIPQLRQTLIVAPVLLTAIQHVIVPYQDIHAVAINFRTQVDDPPYCKTGYNDMRTARDPSIITPVPPQDGLYCKAPKSSPQAVRGARNSPCPNSSARGAGPKECGLDFTRPPRLARSWDTRDVRVYDTRHGTFSTSDGEQWQLGQLADPASAQPTDLRSFLLRPLS